MRIPSSFSRQMTRTEPRRRRRRNLRGFFCIPSFMHGGEVCVFFIARVPRIKFRYLAALPRNHTWARCWLQEDGRNRAGRGGGIFCSRGRTLGFRRREGEESSRSRQKKGQKKITFVAHSFTFKRPFELFLIPKFFLTGRV